MRSTRSPATSAVPTWPSRWSGWSTWPPKTAPGRCSGSGCRPPSGRSRPWRGCWSARARTGRRRTARRGARSWTPGTAATSTWRWNCPATSSARSRRPEQMAEILDLIAGHVQQHRTTLVFVNTRRMAERVAHQLGERLGDGQVAAHHGSLSKDRRQRVESRLRAGDLRALVATASLELGIDIGPVELVCQIGSPRSFATFLQRVGRSNHTRGGTPGGRLYPTSRDELVECAALLRGRADRAARRAAGAGRPAGHPGPAGGGRVLGRRTGRRTDLLALVRRAAPFARPVAGGLRARSPSWCPRGSGPAAAAGPPTCTATRSPAGCAAAAAPGSRRSPPAGRSPSWATTGCWPSRTSTLVGTVNEDWAIESHGRRRVPARHALVADPPGRAGRGPGGRRPGRAAVGPVLAGRGAGPDPRAVGGGQRAPPGGGRRGSAAGRTGRRPSPGWPAECGLIGDAAAETIAATWRPGWPSSACCRPWTPSCWSGSSTTPAGCSWSGTRRSAPG